MRCFTFDLTNWEIFAILPLLRREEGVTAADRQTTSTNCRPFFEFWRQLQLKLDKFLSLPSSALRSLPSSPNSPAACRAAAPSLPSEGSPFASSASSASAAVKTK